MKHSILNLLLGASLIVAAPVAMADYNWKEHKHQQKHVKKHTNKQNKHFAVKQAAKSHNNRKLVKHINRHNYHNNYDRHNQHNPYNNSWSFTTYGGNYYNQGYRHNNKRYPISIRERQNKQAHKIRKGVQKGQLVRKEARRLRGEQRRIADRIRNYRHDGRLNRHEKRKIHRMLDISASNIRNKRHNHLTKHSQNRRYQNNNRYDFVINW